MKPARALTTAALLLALASLVGSAQVPVAETPAVAPTLPVAHAERARVYDVTHYVIDLRFDADRASVSGTTTVRLKPLAGGFSTLSLDAADLDVTAVRTERGAPLRFATDAASETLEISLDRAYAAGEPLGVVVTYSATPKRGLYFFKQTNEAEAAPAQFWSQGEANDNHHWFPCWDYPNDKATADVFMTIDGRWVGVSNGRLVATKRNADGTKTLHWSQDRPNASYLTMVAAGDFAELRASWRGRPVTYVVPRRRLEDAKAVFRRTPQMMEYFSRRIGVDYPWPKYAQIAVTHFMFGGMENTSATTLSESAVRKTVPEDAETPESLVAHELAHQWWGDLVTCRDWSHAWLNEGFATYFALLWTEHAEGEAAFRAEVAKTADEFVQAPAAMRRPLVYDVYRRPFDLFFDGVIYPKGALVLHMLRGVVGDDAFWRGINLYARRHAYGSVTTADLRAAMEEAGGRDLGWFFDEWANGVGYPVFDVTREWDAAARTVTVRVRQTQGGDGVPAVYRMPAELRIETPSGARTERVTLDARENAFTFPADTAPTGVDLDPDGWILKRVTS